MKRILFLVLSTIPLLGIQAHAIEIIANGHKYDSLQAYQLSEKPEVLPVPPPAPAVLTNQQEDDIKKEARQLGVEVDLNKVKTFQVNKKRLSDAAKHQLYVLSVEHGVVGALQEFYQSRGQYDIPITQHISSKQLQEAIEQAMVRSKDPQLLISEPGKVRIMTISPDHSKQKRSK